MKTILLFLTLAAVVVVGVTTLWPSGSTPPTQGELLNAQIERTGTMSDEAWERYCTYDHTLPGRQNPECVREARP